MAECAFENAGVLVLDPVGANLTATRQALATVGFQRIDTVQDVERLRHNLRCRSYELVIAETHSAPDDVVKLAHQIRSGEEGADPFVTLMLTMWAREESGVVAALKSGADDIVLRPFSATFLSGRIRTLTVARKSFLVTNDYIGPVRGRDVAASGEGLISVPSTLRAAALGDSYALARARQEIAEARQRVEHERIRRLAICVVAAARVNLCSSREARPKRVEQLQRAAAELQNYASVLDNTEACRMANALADLATRAILETRVPPDQWRLAQTLAVGILNLIGEAGAGDKLSRQVTEDEGSAQPASSSRRSDAVESVVL